MSCEIGIVGMALLLLATAPVLGPAAAVAAVGVGAARGANQLRRAAGWLRANGLAADQLAMMPLAPVNLSHMEFCTLARACDLQVVDTIRDTNLGLAMTPIATAAGQSFGLVQVDSNTFHLVGAQDLLEAPISKVVPEMSAFHQAVNTAAAVKAMATKLGADLTTIYAHRDLTGTLYLDLNIPNPVDHYRPVEMDIPTPRVLGTDMLVDQIVTVPKPLDIRTLTSQIATAELITSVQAYQAPPEGYLRVAMEVEPTGKMHVSVLGDHGQEEECRPVAEALQEAFQNAEVVCNLRSIGQAPPAPSGIAPLEETLSADRPSVVSRPRQIQYNRR